MNAYTRVAVRRSVMLLMSSAVMLPRGSLIVGTLLTLTTFSVGTPSPAMSLTRVSHVTIGSSGGGTVAACETGMPSSAPVPASATPTTRRDMGLLVLGRLLRGQAGHGLVEVLHVRRRESRVGAERVRAGARAGDEDVLLRLLEDRH